MTGVNESLLAAAKDALAYPKRLFVLTGAGISAESGVPTFRGEGATWRNRRFDELATPDAFVKDPRLVWDWYLYRRGVIANCKPNAAHHALAERDDCNGETTLVTQNVDGLHERMERHRVIRLHGSIWLNRCVKCEKERDASGELAYDDLPLSPCCGAPERPAVVWFGESLPHKAMKSALRQIVRAEVALVVGTSGSVQPAAMFWQIAMDRGITVINVNPEPSAVQSTIDLRGSAAEILPKILF